MNSAEVSSLITEFEQTYKNTAAPLLPERLSNYRFYSCLAESDQKKTWILENANGQKVICKYASGEYVEMLRTESSFGALGKFPFAPYVFDYFEIGDSAYLLREYIEGHTLNELVEKEGTLPLDRAIPLIKQLCGHLSRLHASDPPIIYRDLKPSNIVLHPSGDCYLVDMGAVRTYHEDHSLDTVFIGTIDTAAPEQFGARQTDGRTDIYALGILFYYLLTGELRIQERKLKKLPSRAASIIQKCTAFDPNDRYPDVSRITADLHTSALTKARLVLISAAVCVAIGLGALFLLPRPDVSVEEDHTTPPPEQDAPQEVVFTSPLLEQAIREAVSKTEGEPVYEADLARVTRLYICGDKVFSDASEHYQYTNEHSVEEEVPKSGDIMDISLLEKMPNLHYVVLDYQQIYDLSPLQDLQLVTLSLCGNPVTDLSALAGQKSLTELYLSETAVFSLEGLEECSSLSTLDCSYTSVASLEPVASLPIRSLFLKDTAVTDLGPLSTMPLQELFCGNMAVENVAALADISSLHTLCLQRCGITSLNQLTDFSHLRVLDLDSNMITNLEGLEQFTTLHYIGLNGNPITDLSPLAQMSNLNTLGLATGTNVEFSFLNEMPQVRSIAIFASQEKALYEAVPEPSFTVTVYN